MYKVKKIYERVSMNKMKRKYISIFLVLCVLCATPNKLYAMPITSKSPNWLGWRINKATWNCIPMVINSAEESIKAYDRWLEKVRAVTGVASIFACKDVVPAASCAISILVLVQEKDQIREVIRKMEDCHRQHKDISYKTRARGDGMVEFKLL